MVPSCFEVARQFCRRPGILGLLLVGYIASIPLDAVAQQEEVPPPRTHYMGRRIAPTMGYQGADWLIREQRAREEGTEQLIEVLDIQPGQTICDMGCGNGYYSLELARRVGPEGRVLAVDIQPEMLSLLDARAKAAGVENVRPILGTVADPNLPAGTVDLLLLVDVYHEFSHPERMLRAMRESLKPDGLVVLVEFRAEDPLVPIKPLHKMSKAQMLRELPPNGFKLVRQYDELPWQHVMFFGRDESWSADEESAAEANDEASNE